MSKLNKKSLALSLVCLNYSALCVAQAISEIPSSRENIENTAFIEVYKCDRLPSVCYDAKDVSIIEDGKISKCFKLLKTLDNQKSKKLISILTAKSTYQRYPYDVFTTDYSIVLFNENKTIIGSVNFSFVCNNLYSDIMLREKQQIYPTNPNMVGLSKYGKKILLKTIGIAKQ